MNLDIRTEAKKLARLINSKSGCSRRVVMFLDQMPRVFSVDSRSANYYMQAKPHRIVGVYDQGVTVDHIADDLAEFF
jgi:hypothetical protein